MEQLIFQISISSCTLYLYTITLFFKECRTYIYSYFNHLGIISGLKEKYLDENDMTSDEKDTSINEIENDISEDDNEGSSLKTEKNPNIDNISFNFLCGI